MQPIHWRVGGLALALACSPNSASEPRAEVPSQQAGALEPAAPPSSVSAPPFAGFDDGSITQTPGDVIRDDDACLVGTQEAELIGLDILVMLDSSGSMGQELPAIAGAAATTKWDAVRRSLEAFVQAPETGDIGVGLQYFPQQRMVCDEPLGLCADLSSICSPSVPCAGAGIPCLALGGTGCLTATTC